MRFRMWGLQAIVLGLPLLLQLTRGALAQSPMPASGQVAGHVYAAGTGDPLRCAIVTLDGTPRQKTRTGADGSYSFKSLASGEYNLVAYKTGFLGEIYNLQGGGVTSMRLVPGQREDRLDFHLKPAPVVKEMNDEVLKTAYSSNERLYLNFSSGRFSADRTRLGLVAGDILTGDPEQVWLYELQSHELIAVTDKPTPDRSPAIRDLAWAGDTLYVDGSRRAQSDRRFVVAASAGKIEEISEVPAEVERTFRHDGDMNTSEDVHVGRYVVTGVRLRGGDSSYSARKGSTGHSFTVAAAIHDAPVFDEASSTVFYVDINGWGGRIVAFPLETRRPRTLEIPGGPITLLAAARESSGFLIAYAITGPCTVEESPDGEDPWLIPGNVEYRTRHRPMHVCFVHLPD